jgi:integrase
LKEMAFFTYDINQTGGLVRETTGQSSLKVAEQILAKRRSEVAMKTHFAVRQFEAVSFKKLLDYWWSRHGKFRPSKFEYLLPRLIARFGTTKARKITSDKVHDFLLDLSENQQLSPSSVNHYRTIMNSVFNFAIKWKQYDENPVRPVHQIPERPGRDRFTTPSELNLIIAACEKEKDFELKAFIILAATTGMRKGEILPRKWTEVIIEGDWPFIYTPTTKNNVPKRIPLPVLAVECLKQLPSFGKQDYLFPAKPNVKYSGNFKKPHAWDLGKRFRRICDLAQVKNLRILDLRHSPRPHCVERDSRSYYRKNDRTQESRVEEISAFKSHVQTANG